MRGKVLNSYTASSGPVFYTHYRIEASETLKGQERTVRWKSSCPAEWLNNSRQSFAGVPEFKAGDEYVFFLWTGKDGRSTQVLGLTPGTFLGAPAGFGGSRDHAQRQP